MFKLWDVSVDAEIILVFGLFFSLSFFAVAAEAVHRLQITAVAALAAETITVVAAIKVLP